MAGVPAAARRVERAAAAARPPPPHLVLHRQPGRLRPGERRLRPPAHGARGGASVQPRPRRRPWLGPVVGALRQRAEVPCGGPPMTQWIERRRPLLWLTSREVLRVTKLWTQTIAAPVIASFLFILVFGLSLGGRIKQIDGFPYDVFIVPGLITMAMVQAAYANNSSSVFQARFDRYLHDVLAAPMRNWEVNLGLSLGGAVRALAIAVSLFALALPVTGVPVHQPLVLGIAVVLALVLFSSLGVVVRGYAETL